MKILLPLSFLVENNYLLSLSDLWKCVNYDYNGEERTVPYSIGAVEVD